MTIPTQPSKDDQLHVHGKFITREKLRYRRKGYGLITATIIALSFFYGVPKLAQKYWPAIIQFKSAHEMSFTNFFMAWNILQHNLIHLVCNLCFYVLYSNEYAWVERYKTNFDEPWPWHQDPDGWRK